MATQSKRDVVEGLLADALHRFSLDLVNIVRRYYGFLNASSGVKPTQLLSIDLKNVWHHGVHDTHYTKCGVALSPDGVIWVTRGHTVRRFNSIGGLINYVPEQLQNTTGIAFSAKGEAYIADYEADSVLVCDKNGMLLRRIGCDGSALGKKSSTLAQPFGVAIDAKNELLFVSENGGTYVKVMKLDGSIAHAFGSYGYGNGEFMTARGIALSSAGELGVVDCNGHRVQVCVCVLVGFLFLVFMVAVQVFDYKGQFLRKFGSAGTSKGQLSYPVGLAVDGVRDWLVVDNTNRVQVFSADGRFITTFLLDLEFASDSFSGICVDGDERVLVASKSKVQVLGFCG